MTAQDESMTRDSVELVLTPSHLLDQEVAATVDIVSQQDRLGTGDALLAREGRVRIGPTSVYQRVQEPNLSNPTGDHYYLVVFRFTLDPLADRRCNWFKFGIRMGTSGVAAVELFPFRVTSPVEVSQNYDLGFSISLPPVGGMSVGAKAGIARTIRMEHLKPRITSYRNEGYDFYWKYEGDAGQPVESGDRDVAIVLKAPRNTRTFAATIYWDMRLQRQMFLGRWKDLPVDVDSTELQLALR